ARGGRPPRQPRGGGLTTAARTRHRRGSDAAGAAAPAPHAAWSPTNRIVIEAGYPGPDGGRYSAQRGTAETFPGWAAILPGGHDVIAAALLSRAADERVWRRAPMSHVDNDRWRGQVRLERNIRHFYTIEAWTDVFASWRRDLVKKLDAQQDVTLELTEGRQV